MEVKAGMGGNVNRLTQILSWMLLSGSVAAAPASPFYCVYFYTGDKLIRTLQIHGFEAVSDTCHEWWSADPLNKCRWIQVP